MNNFQIVASQLPSDMDLLGYCIYLLEHPDLERRILDYLMNQKRRQDALDIRRILHNEQIPVDLLIHGVPLCPPLLLRTVAYSDQHYIDRGIAPRSLWNNPDMLHQYFPWWHTDYINGYPSHACCVCGVVSEKKRDHFSVVLEALITNGDLGVVRRCFFCDGTCRYMFTTTTTVTEVTDGVRVVVELVERPSDELAELLLSRETHNLGLDLDMLQV
jgi:hypothetical protein